MADSDDWRVTISVGGQAQDAQAQPSFSLDEVEEDIRRQVGRGIAVGAGDTQIFLVVGASNQDQAVEVAEQIRREAPPGATVIAEETGVGWPFAQF